MVITGPKVAGRSLFASKLLTGPLPLQPLLLITSDKDFYAKQQMKEGSRGRYHRPSHLIVYMENQLLSVIQRVLRVAVICWQ